MGLAPRDEYVRNATVVDVIDGDTLRLMVDMGDDVWHRRVIRMSRINAPEMNTDRGRAAAGYLAALIQGKAVVIKTYKSGHEKYGRLLAEVWSRDTGANLNDLMIQMGHAVSMG